MLAFELKFDGELAGEGLIDSYDGARAIAGFQRSLALTTHLVINGEIITHATSLRGAKILIPAIEAGSWKTKLYLAIGSAFAVASVGKDSPVGHIVTSVYDYVLSETMGFHVDYDKTLQQQYSEHMKATGITRERVDSLIEKTESNIADMHRPVVASKTATRGDVFAFARGEQKLGPELSPLTYEYVRQTNRLDEIDEVVGVVSSYNINTYKGRIYSFSEKRPIPFELMHEARDREIVGIITQSQHLNGQDRRDPLAVITLSAHRLESATGSLKRLHVVGARTAN